MGRVLTVVILAVCVVLGMSSVAVCDRIPVSSATASGEHYSGARGPGKLIDDSGMVGDLHGNFYEDLWMSGSVVGSPVRGGTVAGSHWVELDLGALYNISEMHIWNDNEQNWASMGAKYVTIEYSTTGSTSPGDWTTIYDGIIPKAQANGTGPSAVDKIVDFGDVTARYVVVTVDMPPDHSYYPSATQIGIGEIRFFTDDDISAGTWRDAQFQTTLSNSLLEAKFQAGILYSVRDLVTSEILLSKDPAGLDPTPYLFGSTAVSLAGAAVSHTVLADSVETVLTWGGGTSLTFDWSIDVDDLVLQMSAVSPSPIEQMFLNLSGCDIANHTLVAIDINGTGHEMSAPSTGALLLVNGGSLKWDMPSGFVQPLIVLFEGNGAGWVIEGRDPDVGPSNIRPFGEGTTADVMVSRRYPLTSTTPQMYEVRIRTYNGDWEDAVDPFIDWMENGVGYIPIDQKPQTYVNHIVTQAYSDSMDITKLNALAAVVDPSKTYLGRQAEFRNYSFDQGFPDYSVTPAAEAWLAQARALGFHVGVHINIGGIDRDNTALLAEMAPGMVWTGTEWYGASTHAYCSSAYQPWREHLIAAIAEVIEAGADVIYLDQTNGVNGQFVVDGMTGIEGVMLLEEEIINTYSAYGVTLQTEQFNPMASRHASWALSQMDLGHPLSGYIFSNFINIVPEGIMYSPTDLPTMESFMSYGYILPGGAPSHENSVSWLEIIGAFQQYDFRADSRLPCNSNQFFGYAGTGGVTGYFEKTATTRSFVVYVPGEDPVAYGTRYTNMTDWYGPGVIEDWLIYDGTHLMGLDPAETYWFREDITLDQNRFHLTAIPADYQLYEHSRRRIRTQEIGYGDDYFKVAFSGNGQMDMHVPDNYDVYYGPTEVAVNRDTDSGSVTVSANQTVTGHGTILAFRHSEEDLIDYWSELPWGRPKHLGVYLGTAESLYQPHGFGNLVAGLGYIIGKLPENCYIYTQGSYGMRANVASSRGYGVIRINGTEVLRIDPGSGPPFDGSLTPFDVDISSFAGEHIMLEFTAEGATNGIDYADWDAPEIYIAGCYPVTCAGALAEGYGIPGDLNEDCYIDINDLIMLVSDWLWCAEPSDENCEHLWPQY